MLKPSLKEILKYAEKADKLPVYMELYSDMETPVGVFKKVLAKYGEPAFLLESIEGEEKIARYSFIGFSPSMTIRSYGADNTVKDASGEHTVKGNPVEVLRGYMDRFSGVCYKDFPRFSGGAIGYFGYDIIRQFERLPGTPADDLGLPDSNFMLSDEMIIFDHFSQKLYLIANLYNEGNIVAEYGRACTRVQKIYEDIILSRAEPDKESGPQPAFSPKSPTDAAEYCAMVNKAKQYIKDGDIFQVVLSRRIGVQTASSPVDIYRAFRHSNPSPYMYLLMFGDYSVVGASPEMLARVENGFVETCPIAGTRKRGATPEEDAALAQELMADPKEIAEHIMLVDLGRNDVGKVCGFGSVKVVKYMKVEKFSHVMHLVSNVRGTLRKDCSPFDALISLLPAGTLSGAPKIRAMEIIDELESVKRGPYGGAVCYVGYNGNLDSCITIRTVILKAGTAYVQAGAGIVADSVPITEFEETQNKANAALHAIQSAGEIL